MTGRFSSLLLANGAAFIVAAFGHLHAAGPLQQSVTSDSYFPTEQRAVLDKYCVTCHNEKLKTGGLTLDTLDVAKVTDHADIWEKVVSKVRAGMMPPVGRPRPDHAASTALLSFITAALDRGAAQAPVPGRTDALRRLNRTEYHNAIRDLFALDIDVTNLLTTDDSSNGFDNISLAGLDPGRMERYLTAAKKVSRLALGAPVRGPYADTIVVSSDLPQNDRIEGLPFGTRGGTLFPYTFPLDAVYEFQIRLGRSYSRAGINGLTEPHQIVVTVDGEIVKTFTVSPPSRGPCTRFSNCTEEAPKDPDVDLNVRVPVAAGSHKVGAAFISRGLTLSQKQRSPFQRLHITVAEDQRTLPTLYSVSILGPYDAAGSGDTPSRRRILVCRPASAGEDRMCAKQILSTLARRAYRRPASEEDVQALLDFYDRGRADGAGFESGIENAIMRLLVSPAFLFRIEREPDNVRPASVYRVSDLELASRLSFFLWSSIPDDELLDLASRDRLKEPGVLEAQVRRMLADTRSENLVTNFASQWLQLRNLPGVRPDALLFPDFDESLRQSLQRETELFVNSIIQEDRSAVDLLGADYSFINERLARHYGITNVYGSYFRRFVFDAGSARGGLLGQGSLLAVTSYANRTSPVIRGKWILQNILGSVPPPPPPNVPALPDNKSDQVLSMRERMVEHRANPVCASCHALMDPIGLSLENFDAAGAWRTHGETFASLDVSGNLPGGVPFAGVTGLKKALLSAPELFVATLTEKLLVFALGRPVEYYDSPAIRRVVRDAARDDYRVSSLIIGIVNSVPFQMKTSLSESQAPTAAIAVRQ